MVLFQMFVWQTECSMFLNAKISPNQKSTVVFVHTFLLFLFLFLFWRISFMLCDFLGDNSVVKFWQRTVKKEKWCNFLSKDVFIKTNMCMAQILLRECCWVTFSCQRHPPAQLNFFSDSKYYMNEWNIFEKKKHTLIKPSNVFVLIKITNYSK